MSSPPLWKLPPFNALLSDAYIEGTNLEGGHIGNGLQVYILLLQRLLENEERKALIMSIVNEVSEESGDNPKGVE
jgi:hypothetical protein